MIKASKDFMFGPNMYLKGDEVDIKDIAIIRKLNEKGYIEPLDYRQLVLLERELKKPKKEEVKNDTR